jgi:protein-tyrosine phosphatase
MDASEVAPGLWVASRFYPYDMPNALLVDLSGSPDREAAAVAGRYIWWPFEDGPYIPEGIKALARYLEPEARLVIRCDAGRNRSALLAGLVLVASGYEPDDALVLLRARRTTARMPECLSNETFVAFLTQRKTPNP